MAHERASAVSRRISDYRSERELNLLSAMTGEELDCGDFIAGCASIVSIALFIAAAFTTAAKVTLETNSAISQFTSLPECGTILNGTVIDFSIDSLVSSFWDREMHFMVIWLVICCIILPLATCTLQCAVWFVPMTRPIRKYLLDVVSILTHYSAAQVVLLIVLIACFDMDVGPVDFPMNSIVENSVLKRSFSTLGSPDVVIDVSNTTTRAVTTLQSGCPRDPTGFIGSSAISCSLISQNCDTDLNIFVNSVPVGGKGWMYCPRDCRRCTDFEDAMSKGELDFIFMFSTEPPAALIQPSLPPVECVDDTKGVIHNMNSSCLQLQHLCFDSLGVLFSSHHFPSLSVVWMYCPATCYMCIDYTVAFSLGQLTFIFEFNYTSYNESGLPQLGFDVTTHPTTEPSELTSEPPSNSNQTCVDDASGMIVMSGMTCEMILSACDIDISTFTDIIPKGVLGWMFCPVTCMRCSDYLKAFEEGQLSIIGIHPPSDTDHAHYIPCFDDDNHLTVIGCDVIGVLCDVNLFWISKQAPEGLYGWMICPLTCHRCDDFREAHDDLKRLNIISAPPPNSITCEDDPTGEIQSLGYDCEIIKRSMCDINVHMYTDLVPKGSFGWMYCPLSCHRCEDYIQQGRDLPIFYQPIKSKPVTCADDLTESVSAVGTCDTVALLCDVDLSTLSSHFVNLTFGWMICPVTCDRCTDFIHSYEHGDLRHLGLIHPTVIDNQTRCVDNPSGIFPGFDCSQNVNNCYTDLSVSGDINATVGTYGWMICPASCRSCESFLFALDGGHLSHLALVFSPTCNDDASGFARILGMSCSDVGRSHCDVNFHAIDDVFPELVFGWMLCPASCNRCEDYINAYNNGLIPFSDDSLTITCKDASPHHMEWTCDSIINTETVENKTKTCNIDLHSYGTDTFGTYSWQYCPETCGRCDDYTDAIRRGDLRHINGEETTPCIDDVSSLLLQSCEELFKVIPCDGDIPIQNRGNLTPEGEIFLWQLCPATCHPHCMDWKYSLRSELRTFGVWQTPLCRDAYFDLLIHTNCTTITKEQCDYDLGLSYDYLPENSFGWMLCPETCRRCEKWYKGYASGEFIHLLKSVQNSLRRASGKVALRVVPHAALFLQLCGTFISILFSVRLSYCFVEDGKKKTQRWRVVANRNNDNLRLRVIGITISLVGLILILTGLFLTAIEWSVGGVFQQLYRREEGITATVIKLSTELLSQRSSGTLLGVVVFICSILIPVFTEILCVVAFIRQSAVVSLLVKCVHPFGMLDLLAISILIADEDVPNLINYYVENNFRVCLPSMYTSLTHTDFISVTTTGGAAVPLLFIGSLAIHVSVLMLGVVVPAHIVRDLPSTSQTVKYACPSPGASISRRQH